MSDCLAVITQLYSTRSLSFLARKERDSTKDRSQDPWTMNQAHPDEMKPRYELALRHVGLTARSAHPSEILLGSLSSGSRWLRNNT